MITECQFAATLFLVGCVLIGAFLYFKGDLLK